MRKVKEIPVGILLFVTFVIVLDVAYLYYLICNLAAYENMRLMFFSFLPFSLFAWFDLFLTMSSLFVIPYGFLNGRNWARIFAFVFLLESAFGALSKDELFTQTTEEKCNNETYLTFLNDLLRKYGKIVIVIDGSKYHFEKEHVQKFYEENKNCLKVFQLPPYSPELSPIEQTWKKTKKWLSIAIWGTKSEFKTELLKALDSPSIKVKMFDYYVR